MHPSNNLPVLSQNTLLKRTNDCFTVSLYTGELTTKGVINATAKIKKAFPNLEADFYDILIEMLKEEGFSDKRFNDAVDTVIKNCEYPTPTVAKFMSYDKNIKLYTYTDMVKLVNIDRKAFEKHRPVNVPGTKQPLWAHISDIERYNLQQHEPNNKHQSDV